MGSSNRVLMYSGLMMDRTKPGKRNGDKMIADSFLPLKGPRMRPWSLNRSRISGRCSPQDSARFPACFPLNDDGHHENLNRYSPRARARAFRASGTATPN